MIDYSCMSLSFLSKHYAEIDELRRKKHGMITRGTEKGLFVPTPLVHMTDAFSALLKDRIISKNSLFLDAGCGDGRIVALAGMFGLKPYGIEYDDEFFSIASDSLKSMKENGMLKEYGLAKGDFLLESSYRKLGKKFREFNIVFNFINMCNELAEKIHIEYEKGTVFLIYDTSSVGVKFENVSYLKTITLRDEDAIRRYNNKEKFTDLPMMIDYLHIYVKK